MEWGWDLDFAFGFSHIINDYKMVRIFEKDDEICEVGVFSLRDGCWRDIPFDNLKDIRIASASVTANGVIFWGASKYVVGSHDRMVIASFF